MRYPELRPLLAILDALLIQSMLEGMLHYPRFIMLIMILLAVILTHGPPDQDVAREA
jgi:exopolysaccharide production protein ExoQ